MADPASLLSVDWDFFFPVDELGRSWPLYDWGHHENQMYIDGPLWTDRAAAFLKQGLSLPVTSHAEVGFWNRFSFSADATLYIAESHSQVLAAGTPEHVVSYDAHHDCGYPGRNTDQFADGVVYCDDWLAYFITECGTKATVRYPPWRPWRDLEKSVSVPVHRQTDDGETCPGIFDAVFVCRSGAWTPPWLDDDFQEFIDQCPISQRKILQDVTPRQFSQDEAEKLNELGAGL